MADNYSAISTQGVARPLAVVAIVMRLVARLFRLRHPTTVAGLVVPVVVDPVDRVPWRTGPHVFTEGRERLPALAHPDASSSVAVIGGDAGVLTSRSHAAPAPIFTGVSADSRGNRAAVPGRSFPLKATTAPMATRRQVVPYSQRHTAAVTSADPPHLGPLVRAAPDHHQALESTARKVNEFHHGLPIVVSHNDTKEWRMM